MLRTHQRYWLVGLVVLLGFAIFYVHGIHTTYMTLDEFLVYRFTRESLGETLSYLANRDVHPPLWFSFFWFWRRLVGESDFAGRMQAILFSMMTLTVVYQLGRRWFGAARYGLAAMVILGVSSLFFWYSHEIRPYAFAMLAASLSMLAFSRWMRLKTARSALLYAASVALLLYIHYFMFLFIATQLLYFEIFSGQVRRLWRQGILVVVVVFLLWLPWLPNFLVQFQHIREVEAAAGLSRGVAGSSATTQATTLEEVFRLLQLATNGQIGLYALVLVVSLYYGWRKGGYRLALVWGLGVPLIAFLFNLVIAVYTPRYIVNFIIGLALVLGVGVGSLAPRLRWAALAGFTAITLWSLPTQLPRDIIPYRDLLMRLTANVQSGDVILYDKANLEDNVFQWQANHIFSEQFHSFITVATAPEEVPPARRIWHITNNWFDEDVRANFERIERTHPRLDGWGQCDIDWCYLIQLMEGSPWSQPRVFGEDMPFWGIDIDAFTSEVVNARLWWRVEQTPAASYSIGLHLTDAESNLIAQSDGPIMHYGVELVDTMQLEPGQIYVDFRSLTLSEPIPTGDYNLNLIVYDWQTGERLLLPDGSDHLELDTIHIEAN